ncbi:E3 ubiquitin-protein ligase RLIM-like isoform X1 [Aricia agestis]|uniref:E3 ubiquitin-protein ligase RLIM-like isoform X1 n=1 Tax=Aricia agestis TaxID=91739 RepID=UPI001C2066BE|nr:E3 ubiquitin-protein ligase RLIM-like isoform X1 [Aricia agestis]
MSVRRSREDEVEDERDKSNYRGVGLAAAVIAVGVGVGAALYYFLNKRSENNPQAGGSSQNWRCDDTLFKQMASDDSYTTVSENSTTDTSIMSVDSGDTDSLNSALNFDGSDDPMSVSSHDSSEEDWTHETGYNTLNLITTTNSSTSDISGNWDTTNSSIEPSDTEAIVAHIRVLDSIFPSNTTCIARNTRLQTARREDQEARRLQAFRERSWTLEECSICFDVILKNQEVMSLPCTHQFHAACVMPWLQQSQTCPNCRKSID